MNVRLDELRSIDDRRTLGLVCNTLDVESCAVWTGKVLGRESGPGKMARGRSEHDAPLRSRVVGQGSGIEYGHLGDHTTLASLVDDLRVGRPTEILEWGTGHEIRNVW